VYRHLEIVARNNAAALDTFSRLVSAGSEPDVRTAIATILAEHVFKSDETGLIDPGSDHIKEAEPRDLSRTPSVCGPSRRRAGR